MKRIVSKKSEKISKALSRYIKSKGLKTMSTSNVVKKTQLSVIVHMCTNYGRAQQACKGGYSISRTQNKESKTVLTPRGF